MLDEKPPAGWMKMFHQQPISQILGLQANQTSPIGEPKREAQPQHFKHPDTRVTSIILLQLSCPDRQIQLCNPYFSCPLGGDLLN
eukprot:578568-Pelagomonas_calceolata.AAC.1